MPDLDPDDFDDHDAFAAAVQAEAVADAARPEFIWAIGGIAPDETSVERQYAVEPWRGSTAAYVTDELYSAIEALPDFCLNARIVTREVTYGPWRYVTPEEIENA